MNNPILTQVAVEAATNDYPISGVSVSSPLVAGPAIVVTSWAEMRPEAGPDDLPDGIGITALSRVPASVALLPSLTSIEGTVIDAAWAHGAWDVQRTSIAAGYQGALPPYMADIAHECRNQGYVTWYWRPMMRAPEIRAKTWTARDVTLNKWSLARDTPPPDIRIPPLRPGRSLTIRLGEEPAPHPVDVPTRAWLEQRGTRLVVVLPYNRAVVAILRRLPGRRYDPTDKTWSVPMRHAAALVRAVPTIDNLVGSVE